MKLKKSEIKTCKTAYLYHDGHLVLVHSKKDRDAGEVNWVTMHENIGITCNFREKGRLIIDPAVLPFLSSCRRVEVRPASFKGGSENTKKMGIQVESISLYNGNDYRGWHISNFPGIISSDIYFNENDKTPFDSNQSYYHWSGYPVKNVYREKQ